MSDILHFNQHQAYVKDDLRKLLYWRHLLINELTRYDPLNVLHHQFQQSNIALQLLSTLPVLLEGQFGVLPLDVHGITDLVDSGAICRVETIEGLEGRDGLVTTGADSAQEDGFDAGNLFGLFFKGVLEQRIQSEFEVICDIFNEKARNILLGDVLVWIKKCCHDQNNRNNPQNKYIT